MPLHLLGLCYGFAAFPEALCPGTHYSHGLRGSLGLGGVTQGELNSKKRNLYNFPVTIPAHNGPLCPGGYHPAPTLPPSLDPSFGNPVQSLWAEFFP
jgi:hypothetical protein